LIQHSHHVEVQVLADQYGHCVHLFERECSIQRRHQKILEEAPSPVLTDELRIQMGSAAVQLAQAAGYVNAGTVEFLLGADQQFFFLEMNTRLQVEHPITEYTTGLDLVQLQIEIAAGAVLPFHQEQLVQNGHAIEVRVCAEDPQSFLPATGRIALFAAPSATEARTDAGIATGDEISVYYDSLIAKLIVHAPDRIIAIQRLQAALTHLAVLGVTTNIPLLGAIVAHPAFQTGDTTTDFLVHHGIVATAPPALPAEVLIAAGLLSMEHEIEAVGNDPWAVGSWRHSQSGALRRFVYSGIEYMVILERMGAGFRALLPSESRLITQYEATLEWLTFDDETQLWELPFVWHDAGLLVGWQGWQYDLVPAPGLRVETTQPGLGSDPHVRLEAPMPGTVIRLLVSAGDDVAAHTPLLVIEAMKMEHVVVAPYAGVVQRIHVEVGSMVPRGAVLVEVERAD
jgi:3-methylcrotonyl-CoA carboxylase alpha subunit